MNLLEFNDVTKRYKEKTALNSVSLSIKAGEKVALLGCNGAGKSTFLNIATGLGLATSGSVRVFNQSPTDKGTRSLFSFLPQTLKLPDHLKVKEVIRVVEGHFSDGLDSKVLERLELTSLMNQYCHHLSGGEERKLCFALSLIGNRQLLILDEPTANVDFVSKQVIYTILGEYLKSKNPALLFSSHEMGEVEFLADRVVVLNKGEIVTDGTVSEIKRKFSPMKVSFISDQKNMKFMSTIKVNVEGDHYTLFGEDSDQIVRELFEKQCDFKNLRIEQSGLEEVFAQIWGTQ